MLKLLIPSVIRQNMLATRNLLSQIKLPQFFLSSKNLVFLGLILIMSGCRSLQVTSTATANHTAAHTQRDSIYLHDSIRVEYKRGTLEHSPHSSHSPFIRSPDTVYLEKWHTRWRDRETVRTDTIQVETTKTETVQVRYVPRFYKYCAALTALFLIFILLRVALYLYRRFH